MKRKILKIILFSCFFILLFKTYNYIFRVKIDEADSMKIFYEQEKYTVDVLAVGSSRVFGTINPAILYEDYGIACYDLCGAGLSTRGAYYYLLEAQKTQSPQVVILGIDNTNNNYTEYVSTEVVHLWVGNMKFSKNKWDAISDLANQNQFALLLGYPITHSRYEELEQRDFLPYRGDIYHSYYKGNRIFWGEIGEEYSAEAYPYISDSTTCSEVTEEYLDKIIKLVDEMGAKLIVYQAPSFSDAEEQKVMNGIGEYAESRGAVYLNMNALRGEIGIDLDTEMADTQHANYVGQEKISKYVGDFLSQNYDLPDRRGEKKYYSWKLCAEDYHSIYDGFLLAMYQGSLEGYLGMLKGKDYTILINDDVAVENLESYRELFYQLGVNLEELSQSKVLLYNNGNKNPFPFNTFFRFGKHDIAIYENGFNYDLKYTAFKENTLSFVILDNKQKTIIEYRSYSYDKNESKWILQQEDCRVSIPLWEKR